MNKVTIAGRIANDLELRSTTTGKSICDFRIATNRPTNRDGQRIADFISCRVWNRTAENLVKYQRKGNMIAVSGRLQVDNYKDKEGNNRYNTYILVEDLEYLEAKKHDQAEPEKDIYQEYGKKVEEEIIGEDDYLPF